MQKLRKKCVWCSALVRHTVEDHCMLFLTYSTTLRGGIWKFRAQAIWVNQDLIKTYGLSMKDFHSIWLWSIKFQDINFNPRSDSGRYYPISYTCLYFTVTDLIKSADYIQLYQI